MKVSYSELLNSIDAKTMLISEYVSKGESSWDGRDLLIRHDIDGQFSKSVQMAKWEYEKGIRSTYFVLPSRDYFDYSDKCIEDLKAIVDYGHEIGLHNNALREYLASELSYDTTLRMPLYYLRKFDIEIKGTSAHYFDNCEMWEEFDPKKIRPQYEEGTYPKVSLKDYGFEYEAYFVDYHIYLTDSARKISGAILSEWIYHPSEYELRYSEQNLGMDVIPIFNKSCGAMMLLLHPQSWKERGGEWHFRERPRYA